MKINLPGINGYLPTPIHFDPAICIFLEQENLLLEHHCEQEIRIWNIATHACISSIDLTAHLDLWTDFIPVAASQNRRQVLVGAADGIHAFDLTSGQALYHLETPRLTGAKINPRQITGLSLDGPGNILAASDQNRNVLLIDMNTKKRIGTIDVQVGHARPRLSTDGTLAVSCHGSEDLRIWSTATGEKNIHLGREYLPEAPVDWLFSSGDTHLVLLICTSGSPRLRFFNLEAGEFETLPFENAGFTYTGLRDDLGWVYEEQGSSDLYRLTLSDLNFQLLEGIQQSHYRVLLKPERRYTNSFLQSWTASPDALIGLAKFLANRKTVASPLPCHWFFGSGNAACYGASHRLHMVNLNQPEETSQVISLNGQVGHVQATGKTMATFAGESLVTLDPVSLRLRRSFERVISPASLVSPKSFLLDRRGQELWFSPTMYKKEIVCHDVATGRPKYTLSGFDHDIEAISQAVIGDKLFAISGNTCLIGWDLKDQNVLFTQHDRHTSLDALTCNKAGTHVYTTNHARIQQRDAASGEITRTWDTGIWAEYKGITLNPTESTLFAWSHNGHVVVLNLDNPENFIHIRAHCGAVLNLWPHQDGFYTAGEHDCYLHYWEPPFEKPTLSFLFFESGLIQVREGQANVFGEAPNPLIDTGKEGHTKQVQKILLGEGGLSKQHAEEFDKFSIFINDYQKFIYDLPLIYNMNYEHSGIAGYFNHAKLDLGVNITDTHFKTAWKLFDQSMMSLKQAGIDLSKPRSDSAAIMASSPGGWEALLTLEALCHETYHLWQTMSLLACRQYTNAIRRLVDAKHFFMKLFLSQGGFWKGCPVGSVFEPLLTMKEADFKGFYGMVRFYMNDFQVVELGRKPANRLCTMDLIEGAAFCVQKAAFNSWDVETIPMEANPMYLRAYKEFQAAGGETHRLFMLVVQAALKHGELTHHGHRQQRPTPVQAFRFLLKHFDMPHEERLLETFTFATSPKNYPWSNMLSRTAQVTCHTSMASFHRFCKEIKTRFELTWNDFIPAKDKIGKDLRLKAIFEEMNRRIPQVATDAFGIAMIHDPRLIHQMMLHAITMDEWPITLENENRITFAEDREIAEALDALALLVDSKKLPYCCPDHDPDKQESLKRGHILECNHPEGLNQFTKSWLNRPLRDIIR